MRRLIVSCLAGISLMAAPSSSVAQDYPTKPVRIVVPFSAGGGTDLVGRIMADELSKRLNQRFFVENRPGAGGTLGTDQVAKSAPDGYTLLWTVTDSLSVAPAVRTALPYRIPEDLAFIGSIALQPFALAVNAKLPINSVGEFVTYTKNNPGKLNFGSAGVGSVPHMGNVLLNSAAGIEMVHVPFSGLAPAVNALISGTVDVGLATPSLMRAHAEAGTARILAVTSEDRYSALPDVPTLREVGIDVVAVNSYGLSAPAGVPSTIVERLRRATREIANDKAIVAQLHKLGFSPVALIGDAYRDYITKDLEQWRGVAQSAGIRIGK